MLEGIPVEQPLVGQVMDGENGCGLVCMTVQQWWNQPCLPVIAMHDVRLPVEPGVIQCDGLDGAAEGGKALGIIGPKALTNIRHRDGRKQPPLRM